MYACGDYTCIWNIYLSAHAAETDLSITQKIDKITGKESQQKYTINYTGENKNTALKIEYDEDFMQKNLK